MRWNWNSGRVNINSFSMEVVPHGTCPLSTYCMAILQRQVCKYL
jgi:hypothetical protein